MERITGVEHCFDEGSVMEYQLDANYEYCYLYMGDRRRVLTFVVKRKTIRTAS